MGSWNFNETWLSQYSVKGKRRSQLEIFTERMETSLIPVMTNTFKSRSHSVLSLPPSTGSIDILSGEDTVPRVTMTMAPLTSCLVRMLSLGLPWLWLHWHPVWWGCCLWGYHDYGCIDILSFEDSVSGVTMTMAPLTSCLVRMLSLAP